jgi:hypothetical protein
VRRLRAILVPMAAAIMLQGCVAAVLPIVAAGAIGKRQLDQGKKRARAAEEAMKVEGKPAPLPPIVKVLDLPPTPDDAPPASTEITAMTATERLAQSNISNAYLPFARHALEQVARRTRGENVRSAVLIDKVSLTSPVAMACGVKPLAAIIDLDIAPETPAEMDVEPQKGFGPLLEVLRESGLKLAWISGVSEGEAAPSLEILRKGEAPVLDERDLLFFGHPKFRKQEQRWMLSRDYCVVAIAGDRKSDFDELYEYLRDPDYAIRLDAFINRGWFLTLPPVAAVDSELVAAPRRQEGQ